MVFKVEGSAPSVSSSIATKLLLQSEFMLCQCTVTDGFILRLMHMYHDIDVYQCLYSWYSNIKLHN